MIDLSNEEIVHIKADGIQYLQFKKLLKYPNIKHAYAIKPQSYRTKGQNFKSVNYEKVIENYSNLLKKFDIELDSLVKPNQLHTANVQSVIDLEKMDIGEKFKETDGLITASSNICLATTNADCILLLFYDPIKNVIANVHSGWKGTLQKISENTVKQLIENYSCNPKDIICCICPSIRKCHFEVEKNVKDLFEEKFNYTGKINNIIEYIGKKKAYVEKTEELVDKWTIDTVLINKILLKDCGLLPENIIDSGICSVCNSSNVHSYRMDGKEFGLNTAIIYMK